MRRVEMRRLWGDMPRISRSLNLENAFRPTRSIIKANRYFSQSTCSGASNISSETKPIDIEDLLSKPSWSVSSLLPSKAQSSESPSITSKQLHHLLRLSALPPPKDAKEEEQMLSTLSSQLHFVREIQKVDTTAVEPLRSLRDETKDGEQHAQIGVEALKEAFEAEEIRGKFHRRIRRTSAQDAHESDGNGDWDPLSTAGKKMGRYFVVEGGKEG